MIFFLLLPFLTGCLSGGSGDSSQTAGVSSEYQMLLEEIKVLEDSLRKSERSIDKVAAMELIAKSEAFASGFPDDPQAPFMLFRAADVARGIGVYDLAVQHWEKVYQDYPDYERHAEARFMIGFTYESNIQDKTRARAHYEAFLEKHPDHKLAEQVRQILAVIDKSPEELVKEFKKGQSAGQ